MTSVAPDSRLLSAAAFVREGAVLADVGCDHAYLPVWLCESGRVARAFACDVAEGPCARARATVLRAGLSDRISVRRTDGLAGLENEGITDVTVCGMGGDLISAIIDRSSLARSPDVRLILQPMSKPAHLRTYLAANGFAIEDESISSAGGKLYFCLCVSYDGRERMITPFEAEFGAVLPAATPASPLLISYMQKRADALRKRVSGLASSARDHAEEDALAGEIERYLHDRT